MIDIENKIHEIDNFLMSAIHTNDIVLATIFFNKIENTYYILHHYMDILDYILRNGDEIFFKYFIEKAFLSSAFSTYYEYEEYYNLKCSKMSYDYYNDIIEDIGNPYEISFRKTIQYKNDRIFDYILYHSLDEINLNSEDYYGNTLLCISTRYDNVYACKTLLSKLGPYNINYINKQDYTALMFAIKNNNLKNVELLIKFGADIHIRDICNVDILSLAVRFANCGMVEYFIKMGIGDVQYALKTAIRTRKTDIINFLEKTLNEDMEDE